jgi:hypothetical protein
MIPRPGAHNPSDEIPPDSMKRDKMDGRIYLKKKNRLMIG